MVKIEQSCEFIERSGQNMEGTDMSCKIIFHGVRTIRNKVKL
jgi:hypothetical protein